MRKRRHAAIAWIAKTGVGVAVFGVLAASCADANGPPIVLGNDRDGSASPSLAPVDAGITTAPKSDEGQCISYDCPEPYATCEGTSGLCTTNLSNDLHHCGSCDTECPSSPPGLKNFFGCVTGRCQMFCNLGAADCNHLVDDGCETAIDEDPENCGACGTKCAAGDTCWQGACGCPSGFTACDGKCVRLTDDFSNCGACGHMCPVDGAGTSRCPDDYQPPGTEPSCVDSKCGQNCSAGYADCNKDWCGDGCEIRLDDDPKNCGACGHACAAEQVCQSGRCLCDPGSTLCNFACTDLASDPMNCGACNNVCPGFNGYNDTPTGNPTCILGRCGYECAAGYADCDGHIENGCEVDLMTDTRHCGSCSTQCDLAGGQPCGAGRCLTKPCDAGVVQ